MRSKILLSTLFLIASFRVFAQHADHQVYYNNIVSIGEDNYGLVVGQDKDNIFFITAATGDKRLPESVPVKFYNNSHSFSGTRRVSFDIGASEIVLYEVENGPNLKWLHGLYNQGAKSLSPYYSYIKDAHLSNKWYTNSSAFYVNQATDGREMQLKMSRGSYFFRGMPVVDQDNKITGIISDAPDENGNSLLMKVVDMAAIADAFFRSSQCRFFQLIEAGQVGTRCEVAKTTAQINNKEIKRLQDEKKIRSLAVGLDLVGMYTVSSGNVSGDSQPAGSGLGFGLNIETWPDRGNTRLVFKPRMLFSKMDVPDDLLANSVADFKAVSYSYRTYEMPVIFEFLFSRNKNSNSYWGIGYVPGFQSDVKYKYTSSMTGAGTATAGGTQGFSQKVMAEAGIEGGPVRLDLFAGYQLSNWHRNFTYQYGNSSVDPFQHISGKAFLIGLDLSFRNSAGKWQLKQ